MSTRSLASHLEDFQKSPPQTAVRQPWSEISVRWLPTVARLMTDRFREITSDSIQSLKFTSRTVSQFSSSGGVKVFDHRLTIAVCSLYHVNALVFFCQREKQANWTKGTFP